MFRAETAALCWFASSPNFLDFRRTFFYLRPTYIYGKLLKIKFEFLKLLRNLGIYSYNLFLLSTFPLIFLQLRGPASALSRKFLDDLMNARHFTIFFVICVIRIFTMKIKTFQLRGNNSVCAVEFQLLRGRAPAQLRGNIVACLITRNICIALGSIRMLIMLIWLSFPTCVLCATLALSSRKDAREGESAQ
jgi:hypothetical protein